MHAQSVVLVPKHYLSNAVIQLPRNIEGHATARFTPYFSFLFILQSVYYRESPQNWPFLFCDQTRGGKHKSHMDQIIVIDNTKCSIMVIFTPICSAISYQIDITWLSTVKILTILNSRNLFFGLLSF